MLHASDGSSQAKNWRCFTMLQCLRLYHFAHRLIDLPDSELQHCSPQVITWTILALRQFIAACFVAAVLHFKGEWSSKQHVRVIWKFGNPEVSTCSQLEILILGQKLLAHRWTIRDAQEIPNGPVLKRISTAAIGFVYLPGGLEHKRMYICQAWTWRNSLHACIVQNCGELW